MYRAELKPGLPLPEVQPPSFAAWRVLATEPRALISRPDWIWASWAWFGSQ
jgi:hypothetical protein